MAYLKKLYEKSIDPRFVKGVNEIPNPPPKHMILRLFAYLFLGFIVFSVFFLLTVLVTLRHFKMDFATFLDSVKKDTLAIVSLQSPPTPSIIPIPTIVQPKMVWETYFNIIHNYSILYPSDWTIVDDTEVGTILYPPGSLAYAGLTQNDIGAGIGPKMLINVLTRPFVLPDYHSTIIKTNDDVEGYLYFAESNTSITTPTIDFPLKKNAEILEFSLKDIGQQNINQHLQEHASKLVVKDIDISAFEEVVKSLKIEEK